MMRNSGKPEFRCKSGCLRLAALNDAELGQARVPMQVGLSPTCGIHCCETRASPSFVHCIRFTTRHAAGLRGAQSRGTRGDHVVASVGAVLNDGELVAIEVEHEQADCRRQIAVLTL